MWNFWICLWWTWEQKSISTSQMHLNSLSLGINIYSSKCTLKSTFKNYGNKLSSTVFNDVYVKFTPLLWLLFKSLPRSFLLVVTEASGGGGGTQQIFIQGGSTPRSNPLPFYMYIPFFTKKGTPFVLLLLTNGTPFTYSQLSITQTFKGNRKKFKLSGVWVIGSLPRRRSLG